MAHSDRTWGEDKRPHPALYTQDDIVQMMTDEGPVQGRVTYIDSGGWIYVNWTNPKGELPWFCRSTQLALVRKAA